MSQDDAELRELASALAEGAAIDWASVESSAADESLRLTIHELQVIAKIARVHCSSSSLADLHTDSPTDPFPEALGTWGTLRLLEQVGKGAFGDVYRAWDTRLDREVALKLLPASLADGDARATSIIHEGRLLARVRHPNVVTIYGAERIENRVGLWMEFVNGRTLGEQLANGKVFDESEVVAIGVELCHAIAAVHDAGLLHRDIKAHNVMLSEDGRLVLMDFGSGREFVDKSSMRLAGTPLYLAPELLSGQEPTVRSDIYSLGVLLYHLLTGSYPVRAQHLRDLRLAHERGERTDVRTARRGVATKLARIIERAIEPATERRYQTVDAMLPDLMALKAPSRGVRLLYASGVAAAILLVIAIGWEAGGRQGRWSSTPTALLAGVTRLNPASASVSPSGQPVLAVLPFENLSAEPDNDYLVDGLTDEIIGNLAVIRGLHVISRASSFAFKDKPRNLREVGEQLGANLVVEGSVTRSGNRLRIDARLVQVAGNVPLWAERFDRELHDVFAVQHEISRAIVNKLRLTLGSQRRYDANIDTYILYLKARALVARRGGEAAKAAAELFQDVIRKDPAFAPAYAGLADAYALMSHPTLSRGVAEAAVPLMQQAATKALELDELLAEGHAAMGFFYARRYDWQNAQISFRRAIELDPSLTQTYTNFWSTTLLPLERLDEAERLLQAAVRTDPLSSAVHDHLGFMKLVAGRADEAVDHFTRARALDPNLAFLDQHLGRALTFAGRLPEALSWWDTRMDSSGKFRLKDVPGGQTWMAKAYVMAGRRAEVEQWAEVHGEPYRLAVIHAALGNKDRTFDELYRAAEIVPHRIVPLLSYPEMRLLRGDPRLAALRKKLRLP